MRYVLAAAILAAAFAFASGTGVAFADPQPTFQLGFGQLASLIPSVVGQPLEQEKHNPSNGDALQQTTNGLLVWRKADNWTAFTDGTTTWIFGPQGLQSRPNDERFPWEQVGGVVVAAPAPPPPPGPAAPAILAHGLRVKAMDSQSAAAVSSVAGLMSEVDTEWARVWGWVPSRPTSVYLYFDGSRMADGFSQVSGQSLSPAQKDDLSRAAAGIVTENSSTGGWAVLINLGDHYGSSQWETYIRAVLVHEYTHVMQTDVAGDAGPDWFREGMAELNAYVKVPAAVSYFDRPSFVSWYLQLGSVANPSIPAGQLEEGRAEP